MQGAGVASEDTKLGRLPRAQHTHKGQAVLVCTVPQDAGTHLIHKNN